MNKLSKPKAFEASESIKTTEGIEIANLLRSGIKNQTVILVGHNQKWHEIEIESLRIDDETFLENSHLESAAHYISVNNISLSDMGIVEEVIQKSHDLEHDDFMGLSKMFPAYDYIQISKLHDYEKRNGLPNGVYHKKQTLKMLTDRGITINEYIREVEKRKHAIINSTVVDNAANKLLNKAKAVVKVDYSEVVDESKPQHSIVVETVPVPVPEDSVSITLFESLSPSKIKELHVLRQEQEKIAKENPVIVITDKKTYDQAKKNKAVLLSASTRINGKNGIFTLAKRCVNTFKSAFDKEGEELESITRKPHDEQNKLMEAWDNRILLQIQNRIKELTAIPFTYAASLDVYTLGSIIINQEDIEKLNDKEWLSKMDQAKSVKIAMDALKTEQDEKIQALEKRNEELAAMLEKFLAGQNPTDPEEKESKSVESIDLSKKKEIYSAPISENPFEPVSTQSIVDHQNTARGVETEEKQYSLPHPDNKLLNELDLAHVSVLEEKQYIECREYYAQALQDAADAINDILVNPDKNVQKSVAITELIKTWKL